MKAARIRTGQSTPLYQSSVWNLENGINATLENDTYLVGLEEAVDVPEGALP